MTKRITLRHLEAFRAVILCKTVTSAANMLHVSQPVVTRLVADLEERIGFALFDRQRGRLLPTSEAHALYEEVHRSLIGVDRIIHIAEEIRGLKGGSLQIAAAPAMALSFMPRAISSFVETHPSARITLHMHSSRTVVDMVLGGRCDIGFAMLSMRGKGTYGEVLLSTKMVCAISIAHRLHAHTVIRPSDLQGERFISHPQLLETRLQIDSVFATYGISRQLNIETQTSYALMEFVEAGAGIAIIDPLTAACYRGNGLKFIPFEPTIATDFSILTSSQHAPSMLLKPFIKHVRKTLGQQIDTDLIIPH